MELAPRSTSPRSELQVSALPYCSKKLAVVEALPRPRTRTLLSRVLVSPKSPPTYPCARLFKPVKSVVASFSAPATRAIALARSVTPRSSRNSFVRTVTEEATSRRSVFSRLPESVAEAW